jgi:spectinomycin phosphotransferase
MDYLPEGGGSHHWKAIDETGHPHFVTLDDLDNKEWLGDKREAVLHGLNLALSTADALRHRAGLEFVVAPIPADDATFTHRVDDRYAASVFPYLAGQAHDFGPYTDTLLRDRALEMILALHRATPQVRDQAPRHELGYEGRRDLQDFLANPESPWSGGPYAEPAGHLLADHVADLIELVAGFDRLADRTTAARLDIVITHGEPHPANLMSLDGRVVLIDWDTVGLAPPERDLSLIATTPGEGIERYEWETGREIDWAVITLYRLRWYLDDIASAVRLFRRSHRETPDTRRWWQGLAPRLEQLPTWLTFLGRL